MPCLVPSIPDSDNLSVSQLAVRLPIPCEILEMRSDTTLQRTVFMKVQASQIPRFNFVCHAIEIVSLSETYVFIAHA